MNDLIIDIDLLNINKVTQGIDAVIKKIQQMQQQMNRTRSSVSGVGRAAQQAMGPMQRLAQASRDLQKAMATGTPAQQFDAKFRFAQAQTAYDRARRVVDPPKPSFMQKLGQVLATSRIGIGAGGLSFMPLVGRVLGLLGPYGKALAVALTAATAAIMAFVSAMKEASRQVLEGAVAQFQLMTTRQGVALAGAAGAALGMSPGQASSMMRSIYEGVSAWRGNGIAMGAVSQLGIQVPMGGPFDVRDEAKFFMDMLESLRKLPLAEQQRLLHQLPAEMTQFAPLLKMPADELQRLGNLMAWTFSDRNVQNAMRFNVVMQTMQQIFINITLWIFDKLTTINDWINQHLFGAKPDPAKAAQDAHTNAMNAHTAAMNKMTGAIGGGERARGALPSLLHGMALDKALRGQAINLGAFTV
jgi:hypothetical protein